MATGGHERQFTGFMRGEEGGGGGFGFVRSAGDDIRIPSCAGMSDARYQRRSLGDKPVSVAPLPFKGPDSATSIIQRGPAREIHNRAGNHFDVPMTDALVRRQNLFSY